VDLQRKRSANTTWLLSSRRPLGRPHRLTSNRGVFSLGGTATRLGTRSFVAWFRRTRDGQKPRRSYMWLSPRRRSVIMPHRTASPCMIWVRPVRRSLCKRLHSGFIRTECQGSIPKRYATLSVFRTTSIRFPAGRWDIWAVPTRWRRIIGRRKFSRARENRWIRLSSPIGRGQQ